MRYKSQSTGRQNPFKEPHMKVYFLSNAILAKQLDITSKKAFCFNLETKFFK
jgi:hypothetical protein